MTRSLAYAKLKPLVLPGGIRRSGKLMTIDELRRAGIVPGISGAARGYNQQGDVVTVTADGRDLNQIWRDYQEALNLYNAQRDPLLSFLTFPVTVNPEDVFQGGDTVDFEKASEFGVPKGIRAALPNYFSLGYSFDWYDIGARFTWMFLAESTAAQVDSLNNEILEADNRNVFGEVMRAVFNNVTRAATIRGQNYSVFPFYNGDGTVPPRYKNTVHTAPHTHYLASGSGTVDPGDLTDMENHLKHHGYGWQTGTQLILLANSAQSAVIRTFRVADGADYDFIPAAGTPAWAIPTDVLGPLGANPPAAVPPSSFAGLNVIGRYGPWLVVEEDLIPAGYLLGVATGGEEDARNAVGVREHVNASLRGLRLVKGPQPDYPLVESYYQHGFGTGIRQRGAGVVMELGASPYTIPADYD
jgi:hypothetical protein